MGNIQLNKFKSDKNALLYQRIQPTPIGQIVYNWLIVNVAISLYVIRTYAETTPLEESILDFIFIGAVCLSFYSIYKTRKDKYGQHVKLYSPQKIKVNSTLYSDVLIKPETRETTVKSYQISFYTDHSLRLISIPYTSRHERDDDLTTIQDFLNG